MKYKIYKTSEPKYFPSYLIAYSDKGDKVKAIKVHSGPLAKWDSRNYHYLDLYYKKLTVHKIPEVFEKLINLDDSKTAIFNYLFRGKYEI